MHVPWFALLPALGLAAASPAGAGVRSQDASAAAPGATETPSRPRSMLVRPVHLSEEVPESRALRHLVLEYRGQERPTPTHVERTREEALARAAALRERAVAGEDFGALVLRFSEAPTRRSGGVLGTFARGVLDPAMEEFLYSAQVGEISEPLALGSGVHLVQRIDRDAACRQILVEGEGEEARAEAEALLERARGGEDFAALAREHSDDETSARRGGQLSIFERGPFDTQLKRAAFEAEVGEVVGPVATPLGYHVLKRVPLDDVDPELAESNWIRARAILVVFGGAPGYPFWVERTEEEAAELAHELYERIAAGEDMAALAREHDDDPAGPERSGDLGWIHRRTPGLAPVLDRLFRAPSPTLFEPIRVPQGWVILRRER